MNPMIYSLWRKAPEDASILRQFTPSRSEILWPLIKETRCDGLEVSQGGTSRCSDQGAITSNSICSQTWVPFICYYWTWWCWLHLFHPLLIFVGVSCKWAVFGPGLGYQCSPVCWLPSTFSFPVVQLQLRVPAKVYSTFLTSPCYFIYSECNDWSLKYKGRYGLTSTSEWLS